ncbi:hypothetical protein [Erythrobacter sp. EC-HK427]|uniref:hypothetical protein n=1 Tax=Erythrobacter sp. EC-HK427 TaxID=2038396 RepID=UPI00125FA38C|nr:hypothetical protein [Erythrobacter sp. EC-HK427]
MIALFPTIGAADILCGMKRSPHLFLQSTKRAPKQTAGFFLLDTVTGVTGSNQPIENRTANG